jgi:hypothetical protein
MRRINFQIEQNKAHPEKVKLHNPGRTTTINSLNFILKSLRIALWISLSFIFYMMGVSTVDLRKRLVNSGWNGW